MFSGRVGLLSEFSHDQRGVDSQHAKRVVEDKFDGVNLAGLVDDKVGEGAFRIEIFDVRGGVHDVVLEGGEVSCQFEGAGRAHGVADEALGVVYIGAGAIGEDFGDGFALLDVPLRGGGGVGVDDIDVAGLETGVGQGRAHALGLPDRIGQDVVAGVGIDAVADDLAEDGCAAGLGVFQALQGVDGAALGDDDAVAPAVEGTACLGRIGVLGQGALALEPGEDAEGLDALADPSGEGAVHFAEAEHLHGLDKPGVACGAGGPDGVVGAGDAHVDGDLSGRVVSHGARVVVVRPVAGVVVELGDVVDLVLRLHIAMFGGAYIDADSRLVDRFKVQPAGCDGFPCAVDGDASSPGAHAQFLARLVFLRIEVADTGRHRSHVAHFNRLHTGDAVEQLLAVSLQTVAVWCGQAHACYDDAFLLHG